LRVKAEWNVQCHYWWAYSQHGVRVTHSRGPSARAVEAYEVTPTHFDAPDEDVSLAELRLDRLE
jgi:hypothetical protein